MKKDKSDKYTGIRLSASSINTFRRCPREFYYSYVLRLPQEPSIHLIKGNVVHSCLEKFFGKYEKDLNAKMFKLLEKEWKEKEEELEGLGMTKEELEREKGDCYNMLDIYLRQFQVKLEYYLYAGKAKDKNHAYNLLKPKFREKFYKSKTFNLCGFVDRINVDFDGKITIADYKTSNKYGVGIKYDYLLQCGIYALLYRENEKKLPDFTSVVFLRFGEEIITRVTPGLIKETIDVVRDTDKKTKSDKIDDYHKKESRFCNWCSHFEKCSGMEEVKDEKRVEKMIANAKKK